MNLFVVVGKVTSEFIPLTGCFKFFVEETTFKGFAYKHEFIIFPKYKKFKSLKGHQCIVQGSICPKEYKGNINKVLYVNSIEVLDYTKTKLNNTNAFDESASVPELPNEYAEEENSPNISNTEEKGDGKTPVDDDLPF